jgi:hypothetical protein
VETGGNDTTNPPVSILFEKNTLANSANHVLCNTNGRGGAEARDLALAHLRRQTPASRARSFVIEIARPAAGWP